MKTLIVKTTAYGLEVFDLYSSAGYLGRFLSEQGARSKALELANA